MKETMIIEMVCEGPVQANSYLLACRETGDAAIIDVPGPIATLVANIKAKGLTLKYFLFTHGHFDHVMGLPEIRDRFPDAKVCIHKKDFTDMALQRQWFSRFMGPEFLQAVRFDPQLKAMYEFDPATFGSVDVFVEDGQKFNLGDLTVYAVHSPGHSPGSVCYAVNGVLFSGDVLFYRSVGRTDILHSSSTDQVTSVRRLYSDFPDETIVYPGHGESTDIGSEKYENPFVNLTDTRL